MKTLKAITLSLIIGLTIVSCAKKESKEAQEFNNAFKDVMAVHDEVMPKMNEMGKLSSELKAKVDTTSTDNTYQQALDSLGNAHKSMMKWMEDFSNEFPYAEDRLKGKTTEDILNDIKALKKEKEKVDNVRNAVNGSINNAKAVLAK